jgi:hypothetical protein
MESPMSHVRALSLPVIAVVFAAGACDLETPPDEAVDLRELGAVEEGVEAGDDVGEEVVLVPGPEGAWEVESEEPWEDGGPWDDENVCTEEEDSPSPCIDQSVPGLRGTTQTCIESFTPPVAGTGIPLISCDANGNIVCTWVATCGYHYRNIDGCAGDCITNDTLKVVTKKDTLDPDGPSWINKQLWCQTYIVSSVGHLSCMAEFGLKFTDCTKFWPTPTPTTTCK